MTAVLEADRARLLNLVLAMRQTGQVPDPGMLAALQATAPAQPPQADRELAGSDQLTDYLMGFTADPNELDANDDAAFDLARR